jgi:hypothetical protein
MSNDTDNRQTIVMLNNSKIFYSLLEGNVFFNLFLFTLTGGTVQIG